MQTYLSIGGSENTLPVTFSAFNSERRCSLVTNRYCSGSDSVFVLQALKSNQKAEINIFGSNAPARLLQFVVHSDKKAKRCHLHYCLNSKKAGKHQHQCFQKNVIVSHVGTLYPCLDPLPKFKWDFADNAFWS